MLLRRRQWNPSKRREALRNGPRGIAKHPRGELHDRRGLRSTRGGSDTPAGDCEAPAVRRAAPRAGSPLTVESFEAPSRSAQRTEGASQSPAGASQCPAGASQRPAVLRNPLRGLRNAPRSFATPRGLHNAPRGSCTTAGDAASPRGRRTAPAARGAGLGVAVAALVLHRRPREAPRKPYFRSGEAKRLPEDLTHQSTRRRGGAEWFGAVPGRSSGKEESVYEQEEPDQRVPRPSGPERVERGRHGEGAALHVDRQVGAAEPALLGSDRAGRGGERGEDLHHVRHGAPDGGAERKAARARRHRVVQRGDRERQEPAALADAGPERRRE